MIIYTDHAEERAEKRFIKREWIEQAIKKPDNLINVEYGRKQAIKKMALTIETRRRKQSLCNIFYVFVIKLLCPKDDDKKKLASEPRQLVRSTEVLNGVMGEMRLESHLSADGDGTMFYPDTPKAGV